MQQVAVNHPWHPYSPKGVTKGEDDSPWHRPVSTAQCAASGAGCGSAKGPSGHSWHPNAAQTPSRTTYCPVPSPLHKHWDVPVSSANVAVQPAVAGPPCCQQPAHSTAMQGCKGGHPESFARVWRGPTQEALQGRSVGDRWLGGCVSGWVGGWVGGWVDRWVGGMVKSLASKSAAGRGGRPD